jgi:thiamine-phosphate pyrophosphorylase
MRLWNSNPGFRPQQGKRPLEVALAPRLRLFDKFVPFAAFPVAGLSEADPLLSVKPQPLAAMMRNVNNNGQLPWRQRVMSDNQHPTAALTSSPGGRGRAQRAPGTSDSVAPLAGNTGTIRILDAQANRAAEGLRVVEDYVRFVLDDRHLTGLAKQLRHDLTAALQPVATAQRLACRESQSDVGGVLAAPAEPNAATQSPGTAASVRSNAADVAAASFNRLQQALRSLEEYGKLVDPAMATQIEKIRFRSYTLQRAVGITADSLSRLADARLYVLVDASTDQISADEETFAALMESLVAAGVHVLQLRDKQLSDAKLLARARRLREITRGTPALFIMNDRPDLAVLSAADGIHVGQDELTVKDARAIVGPHSLIGVSTHNIQQARQAVLDGANYIGVGPTFPSITKKFESFAGLDFVRAIASEISLPAFAIGGITLENVSQVISSGLSRIALSAAITAVPNPTAAAQEFLARLTS